MNESTYQTSTAENESLVAVDENGTISAAGEGVAVVTAAAGSREAKIRVNVLAANEDKPPAETDPPIESDNPEEPSGPSVNGDPSDPGSSEPSDKNPAADQPQGPDDGSQQNQPKADDVTKNTVKNNKKTVSVKNVKTGDPTNVRFWMILLCASSGVLLCMYRKRRKAAAGQKAGKQ